MSVVLKCFWEMGGLAAVLAATVAWEAGSVSAATYSFASVRDTNSSGYTQFVGGPSINDAGIVAFIGVQSGQGRVETTGGSFGFDVDLDQQTVSSPTVSNGSPNPHVAIRFTASRPNVVTLQSPLIYYLTTNGEFSDFGVPAINDVGAVAFYADLDNGGRGIYVDQGPLGDDYTIADSEGLFNSFGKTVSINNSATVAFPVSSGNYHAIFLASDSSSYAVAANSSGPLKTLSAPSLNELGVVTFCGDLDNGGSGVFTSSVGAPVITIAESGGQLSEFGNPVINDSGVVAFSSLVNSLEYGIFTGGDAAADKVIQVSDPLFDSTVTELEFFRGLNNHGQIAFRYALANGVKGLAVATPVPEPATAILALVGTLGAAWLRLGRD